MFKIVHAQFIAPGIKRFIIEAPRIARKHKPGQFLIVRLYEEGERIPLTIEKSDPSGTINIVVQSIGKTTHLLNSLETGDSILDVVGPLGKPSEIENFGTVVIIGGGVGTAMAYSTAAAMKRSGNRRRGRNSYGVFDCGRDEALRQSRTHYYRRQIERPGNPGTGDARSQRRSDGYN